MASLRAATVVWSSVSVDATDVSSPAYCTSVNTAVYISNEGVNSLTFGIQVAETGNDKPGLNEFDASDLPDGGLVWYDVLKPDASAALALTVAGGAKVAFDLSPFSPQLVRLKCSAGASASAVTAIVASYGPN